MQSALEIRRKKPSAHILFKHTVIILFAAVMLYPLMWMLISSFKSEIDIFNGHFFAENYTLGNYITGWAGVSGVTFATFFRNSLVIAVVTIVANVLSCSITAFAFARLSFKGRGLWFSVMMLTMMLPSHVVTIPQYIMFSSMGWLNTYLPLLVPKFFATEAFYIFLMVQFMRGIPKEIEHSAMVDGCNLFQVLVRIILPLSSPSIVTTAIFSFIHTWNEFFNQLLYISDLRMYTISLGLRMFQDAYGQSSYGALFAMSTLSLVPLFLLFVFFQKYLIEGVTAGAVKG